LALVAAVEAAILAWERAMSYPTTDDKLDHLIAEALKDPELQEEIADSPLDADRLTALVKPEIAKQQGEPWAAAGPELNAFNLTEAELERERRAPPPVAPQRSWLLPVLAGLKFVMTLLVGLVALGIVVGIIAAFVQSGFSGEAVKTAGITLLSGMILGGLGSALLAGIENLERRYTPKEVEASSSSAIPALEQKLAADETAVDLAVIRNIKGYLRALIGGSFRSSYAKELPMKLSATGLSELSDPTYDMATNARQRLQALMDGMGEGSIGVAGPRGVGKTTLLRSLTEPGAPGALTIITAAPVQYEGRDFILHLFASLCRRVLELKGIRGSKRPQELIDQIHAATFASRLQARRAALPFVFVALTALGVVLVACSIVLTWAAIEAPIRVAPPIGAAATIQPAAAPPPANRATLATWIAALRIRPGSTLVWGIVFIFGGGATYITYRATRPAEPGRTPDVDSLLEETQRELTEIRYQQSYASGWTGGLKFPVGVETGLNAVVSMAQSQLTLPEIVDRYRRFVRQVAPEQADNKAYRRVIVAIDEIDKLQSDEQAYRFLNEIKAIFCQPRCFYLVSVSENAMSNFERRGLNFRDAFDSAFDEIFLVEYLSLSDSDTLLRKRVPKLPRSFVCLLHCLAGGLPRELVRTCRSLVAAKRRLEESVDHDGDGRPEAVLRAERDKARRLSRLASELIHRDLELKFSAMAVAAKGIGIEPDVDDFLEQVHELEGAPLLSAGLLDACVRLWVGLRQDTPADEPEGLADRRQRLRGLRRELGAYLYFAATVIDIFVTRVEHVGLSADDEETIEQLAKARQALALNARVAASIISAIRTNMTLTPRVPFPEPAVATVATVETT
jgi:hypothetical protein